MIIRTLRRDTAGVTALEYGLVAGVLGLILIGLLKGFGSTLSTLFVHVGNSL